ncbi:MAG: VOC family protein [Chloroflexi bacterium]|jgi:uncharacterized protein|nr:VOC family protein [Chloroflexota bacterium]
MSKHPIIHIEFSAADREAAGQFYNSVFDWKIQQMPEMNYATFTAKGGPGGGFNPVSEENPAGTTLIYISTDDIPATLAQIEKHGGTSIVPETEIPGVGWFAVFKDPTGNTVALYKDKPQ